MWTDGSQQIGVDRKKYAGYGAWFREGHALNFSTPLQGSLQTNRRAELAATIEVLKLAPQTTELQLCVDSQLVTDGATLWLEGWKRRGWKTKKGQAIKNIDLWQQMDEELRHRQAAQEWVKVPSHVDLDGNEHADSSSPSSSSSSSFSPWQQPSTTPQPQLPQHNTASTSDESQDTRHNTNFISHES